MHCPTRFKFTFLNLVIHVWPYFWNAFLLFYYFDVTYILYTMKKFVIINNSLRKRHLSQKVLQNLSGSFFDVAIYDSAVTIVSLKELFTQFITYKYLYIQPNLGKLRIMYEN